jgi:hypothetical protein
MLKITSMDSGPAIKVFAAAGFVGLLAGIGTLDLGYALGAFVLTFLGLGGYEFITVRR